VRFAHQFLLEYFSAMHYIKHANDVIDEPMLQKIARQLPSSSYRVGVFKWLLRYAINNGQPEGIHKIFYLPLSTIEKSYLLEYLAVHYQHEGEKQIPLRAVFPPGYFRKNPLSRFINDNFLHFGKKRVLNALLDLSEMPEDKLKIRSILFTMSLLQLDAEQCELELNNIKKLISRDTIDDEVWVSPYDLFLFVYEYMKFGIINEGIKDKIYNYSRYLTGSTKHAPTVAQETVFKITGLAFALLNDHSHMFNYTRRIFECFPALVYQRTNPLRLSLLCWQAMAYLSQNNFPMANKICQHTEKLMRTYSFDFTSGKHIEVLQKMILAEVHFKEKELNRAIRTAEAAIEICQKMDFKLLLLTGFKLLSKMYSQVRFDKQYNQAQQQMTLINKSTSFKHFDKLLVAVTQNN
jgi:tetratricopeptide (TPR) repeat protein